MSKLNLASPYRPALAASGVYFVFQGLQVLAGFISLPLLTRVLTKEDYGLLNLTFASVGILVVVGRLGFGEAAMRFYYERKQQGAQSLREFCGTMVGGSLAAGALVAFLTATTLIWTTSNAQVARCVRLATLVVVTRVVLGVIYQIFRGQERPLGYALAQMCARYGSLVIVVALWLAYRLSAYEVIFATVVSEAMVAIACLTHFAARGILGRPTMSAQHINAAISYGLPLALASGAGFMLEYGDRFLIQRFLGFDAVATYAVPYDLTTMLAVMVFGSLKLALQPAIFRLWETAGRQATAEFVSQVFTYSIALAIPVGALFIALNHDLIVVLASAKYAQSAQLTAYLLPGVFLGELNFLVAAGLMIQRKTATLAAFSLGSGVLNVGLNLLWLPRWGLAGAALATTVSYVFLLLGTYTKSCPLLTIRVRPVVLAEALLTTGIMILSLTMLGRVSAQPVVDILVRGAIGAGVGVLCMSVLDRDLRQQTWWRVLGNKPSLGPTV